ncbi:MAG TPA: DUF2807 domain-containing protein [Bacteroidales bacterium]|nr:DUF2807 domain-containing protein [Bacteroidales bacterium]HRZ22235.1 DUF2807 domain-containing protein [Bacteroidales bacterium]
MKRITVFALATALLVLTAGFSFRADAQWQKGDGDPGRETRDLPAFDKIDAGGVAEIRLSQGTEQRTEVEADKNLLPYIKTSVEDETLVISTEKIRDFSKLIIHVTLPGLTYIHASGASHVIGVTPFEIPYLMIEGSGACEVEMELSVQNLESELSGAAEVNLEGTAGSHNSSISGAASLEAFDLETQTTTIDASGASEGEVTAIQELNIETSGAAEVKYSREPETLITNPEEGYVKEPVSEGGVIVIRADDWDDETEVKVGGVTVNVKDDDTVRIKLGNKELIVDEDGHVEFHKLKVHKFNGHWGGFHLGINGYVDPDFSTQVPPAYDFLDLKYEQSIDVHINAYEQNFNLVRNHLGLITGIGFTFNSYRYGKDLHFVSDTTTIWAFHGEDVYPDRNYEKSKLKVVYLNIPLLLEYQTNSHMKTNSFHITAGVMGGVRLGTKSKVVWDDDSKEKDWDDFHMNPFRWDAFAGIGWGVINLYATYSLNPLFQKDEGPELYPFSIGLVLLNW